MKKLTRRAYNRKIMMFGAAIFMSIAMISTGFAAWVMSSVTGVDEATGPVAVEIVTDELVTITIDQWGLKENSSTEYEWKGETLIFDAVAGDNEGRVIASEGTAGEDLKLTVTGDITNHQALTGGVTATFTLPESIVAAMGQNYIALDYVGASTSAKHTHKIEGNVVTVSFNSAAEFDISLNFKWGTAFDGENPCYYYEEGHAGAPTVKNNATMKGEMETFWKTITGNDTLEGAATYDGTIYITINETAA